MKVLSGFTLAKERLFICKLCVVRYITRRENTLVVFFFYVLVDFKKKDFFFFNLKR